MKPEEIQKTNVTEVWFWVKELCVQIALLREAIEKK